MRPSISDYIKDFLGFLKYSEITEDTDSKYNCHDCINQYKMAGINYCAYKELIGIDNKCTDVGGCRGYRNKNNSILYKFPDRIKEKENVSE